MKIFDSTLIHNELDLSQILSVVKANLNLKSYLIITESVMSQAIANNSLIERAHNILLALKDHNSNFYD